ncbi:MAG: type II secretion system protein [Treponema sp.]|nr:type II secretion system protein [Treponema sp.]
MKKQGFTLIELMVVIVIMGILAAVAVPKLFGMIAKSKASEIGPAAGEYIKLQDAYISESGTGIGDWKLIGYKMNSTTNFKYFEVNAEMGEQNGTSVLLSAGKTGAWKAQNTGALNDCVANSWWQLDIEGNTSSGGSAVYSAGVTGGPGSGCAVLTPNFDKFDTKDGQLGTVASN